MSLLDPVFQWLWRNRALDALIKRPLLARLPPSVLLRLALLTGSALDEALALLLALCGGVSVSVDVGAYYGLYTYYLARHAREVWAFEPLPSFAAMLSRAFPRAHVEAVALSESAGSRRAFSGLNHRHDVRLACGHVHLGNAEAQHDGADCQR